MTVYSIWPFMACLIVLLLLAETPIFSTVAVPTRPNARVTTFDGLRGFLALAVYFHHNAIYQNYLLGLGWHHPPSRFFTMLGQVGVSLFFMITGFLFWEKLLNDAGRPNWLKLYVGRAFRIWPVYLVAITCMMVIVFTETGLKLQVSPARFIEQIIRWIFFAVHQTSLNGDQHADTFLADVIWTLHYEWLFYFCLPLTAIFARRPKTHLWFPIVGLLLAICLYFITNSPKSIYPALFFTGMLTASLRNRNIVPKISNFILSACVVVTISVEFSLSTAYCPQSVVFLGVVFYLVATGSNIFGILHLRGARRLGDISYGIYLLQGIVLTILFRVQVLREFSLSGGIGHWIIALFGAIILIVFAYGVHVGVERPMIQIGRRSIVSRRKSPILLR